MLIQVIKISQQARFESHAQHKLDVKAYRIQKEGSLDIASPIHRTKRLQLQVCKSLFATKKK